MRGRTHPGPLLILLLAGCDRPEPAGGPWLDAEATAARQSGSLEDRRLTESSGVAASRSHPGVLWTHNDAGNPAILFATDTAGRALGRWPVAGAESRDWEDIALGPCPAGTCLTIGDVGDNAERRAHVVLYRIPEPDPSQGGVTLTAEHLVVRYPDRPRDVEALWVDPSGDTWLVSKGRSDGVFLYRVPATAWDTDTVMAGLADTLPIAADILAGRAVTGAALAPDAGRVAIRTYRELHLFTRAPDGTLTPAPGPNRCDVIGLGTQGEAVDWLDTETLVLTSERRGGAGGEVHLLRCG